ncbi:uncharacterized protein METZ01_LOCUS7995 [marine metagenome]|uniref:Uncharacterized protein n=1 Tax=marine metagenome TaxID=408172 RepID=A0A381NKR4_9ZZZZ|tara:strand:+ start:5928 stop:6377 length:450 start_codon:yes stop_codon:yes gene_type:complete
MNIEKTTTLVSASLGVLGLIFLALIIVQGDDAIEMSAMQGDYGTVSYIIYLAQFILLITVLITLFFSLKNLASDKGNLKKSLMFIGAFAVVILVAYLFSSGEETPMQDGKMLSAAGARIVETGIRTFYFLTIIAVGAMAFHSVKKLIKK